MTEFSMNNLDYPTQGNDKLAVFIVLPLFASEHLFLNLTVLFVNIITIKNYNKSNTIYLIIPNLKFKEFIISRSDTQTHP